MAAVYSPEIVHLPKLDEAIFAVFFEGMTRSVNEFKAGAEGSEQQRAREHVKHVFGREPEMVRRPRNLVLKGVCFARVQFGLNNPVEFILANGLLIGLPNDNRGANT